MALTGHLSDLSLSELIEFFCNQRKTGQLKVLYPDGYGYFYLQAGSVIDARIGVLRGIDAVYYALTLPNAKFEFGPAAEGLERTINQPWTQVVLEGLRRLDEGVIPTPAFPPDYKEAEPESQPQQESAADSSDLADLRVPGFLSFISKESVSRRKYIAVAVAVVVVMAVAAIGVPAGWYGSRVSPVVSQPNPAEIPVAPAPVAETPTVADGAQPATEDSDASDATKRQRERDRIKAREEREQKAALNTSPTATTPTGSSVSMADSPKGGPKRVTVTVTYDESGRVTQASGGDATAVRIARQKRFPAGKAGSTTVTIPIN